ncbi:MAG: HNH endonuclease signature motif containing protein [Bacteroidetes bacterium]|nr:HNH endonuclease signature motif containing protein [Bacteroidota bacterium]
MANFTDDKIKAVWQNAKTVANYDANKFRQDVCGAWIGWDSYGKETSLGWEVDHILPVSKGGTDHTTNLRALNWQNNRSKADDFPSYKTAVTADGEKNVAKESQLTVNDTTLKQLKELYPNSQYLKNLTIKS